MSDGVDSAISLARTAARDKLVQVVGGASVVQQLVGAGLVDELHLDIMPVVSGAGLRLFEHLGPGSLRLEKLRVQEVGARTSLAFRVMSR